MLLQNLTKKKISNHVKNILIYAHKTTNNMLMNNHLGRSPSCLVVNLGADLTDIFISLWTCLWKILLQLNIHSKSRSILPCTKITSGIWKCKSHVHVEAQKIVMRHRSKMALFAVTLYFLSFSCLRHFLLKQDLRVTLLTNHCLKVNLYDVTPETTHATLH